MEEEVLVVVCPKKMVANYEAYNFLLQSQFAVQNASAVFVQWDMSQTKNFDTSLLAILYFIFNRLSTSDRIIYVVLPNGELYFANKSMIPIFNYYAKDKRAFFKPRVIGDKKHRETEDVLLKYLKKLELEKYDTVKTLISELFANIKMHTNEQIGFIAGNYNERENQLIISIANAEYSIAKQLELKGEMIFDDDLSAITWALKKSTSTRDENESGGLGLYLLSLQIKSQG